VKIIGLFILAAYWLIAFALLYAAFGGRRERKLQAARIRYGAFDATRN